MTPNQFICEPCGKLSASRLAFLLWSLGVLLVWAFTSLKLRALQPIDTSVVTILSALTAGKVVQRFAETPKPGLTPPA